MSTEIAHIPTSAPSQADLSGQLALINRKLDLLTQQVGYLHRRTAAVEELKDELMPVARDALGALREELAAIEHEFNSEEVVHLLRKLLRNTPRLIRALDQLETLDSFVTEVEPLGKEVLRTVIDELETFERRGYFRLLRGGLGVVDKIAAHYSQEDIDQIVENVVTVLDTVKGLTQPEVLALADKAAQALNDGEGPRKVGMWRLMRSMREPEVQAGLGLMLQVVRQLGSARADGDETDTTSADDTDEA